MTISLKNLSAEEYFLGHKACGGCGGSLVVRWTLKVLGERSYVVMPAGCMSAVGFIYPQMALGVNAMISPFAATGAVLSGIAAAVRAKGLRDVHVVGFAGDGGTADIGLQSLSGAFDRKERIIYICYDNEAYMNTGIQRSGATPWGARTTTSPGGFRPSSPAPKKDLVRIAAAHGVPFAATASVGYPTDFLRKVEIAGSIDGPSFLHVYAPCPTGWACESDATIRLGKSVVDTGLWPLVEWRDGAARLNRDPEAFVPLADYLAMQGRFKTLRPEEISAMERVRDGAWKSLRAWVRESSAG
ncbi:thiamine pyrophosphate-dependent enzyme [Telmatospirillum siberiense]|uniref:2-ketoisovalerate ferredoxin oxidoreductase n=1 Tax=Telmatospirillum siberiense TaxID=382514 RepID=A0A2N3PMN3_9PROT|nr:thiamine pyrophosphate-dependent enzyme [Telmatospirillum siberiense]PKU21668.1 2-ketoisovalerate ferredoxin oxidoreductase [Telmatospirillum siberiense]